MWVYVHLFPNGKRYVGQTVQKVEHRWGNGSQYKTTPYVFNAIKKCGWNNIEHTVYEVNTKEEMDYLERYLISYYNTRNKQFGYNIASGGNLKKELAQETKDKIKQSLKGRFTGSDNSMYGKHHTEDFKKRMSELYGTTVKQYDLDGNYVATYCSFEEAAKAVNGCRSSIARAVKRNNNKYKNFIWE